MPNVDSIYSLQIPKGLSLKDMEGYCPGSNGQVKLHYWTNDNPLIYIAQSGLTWIRIKILPINGN